MEYKYVAYDCDSHLVRGSQAAITEDVALRVLSGHGYRVLILRPAPTFLPNWGQLLPALSKVPPEAVINFSRQLALLLESGVDLVNALGLLRKQEARSKFKRMLGDMVVNIRGGERLSQALRHHPGVFSKVYIESIAVGEQVGSVETMLRHMAEYIEKEVKAAKNIKSALQYPAVACVVAVAVVAVLAMFVLPAFASLYESLGANLPTMTKLTLAAMRMASTLAPFALAVLPAGSAALYFYRRTPNGRNNTDRAILKLPMIGRIAHLNELVRCCRGISILHKAGLPVAEIMNMIVGTSNNAVVKEALMQVHQDVLKGEGLSKPMAKNPLFLPLMVQMTSVGESTGNLDTALAAAANSYEAEADSRMRSAINLIQPTVTVILGVVVGAIALSLVTAMYSIYGQSFGP
ncbi:MAG: type II secretion system F family protein [Chloroflexi bacterium]|nr:type II secretion system F family protein [Chloroflexota bacterium]